MIVFSDLEHLRNDGRPEMYTCIYIYKFRAIERTRKLISLAIIIIIIILKLLP